jgi:hypothetical protein
MLAVLLVDFLAGVLSHKIIESMPVRLGQGHYVTVVILCLLRTGLVARNMVYVKGPLQPGISMNPSHLV